MSQENRLPEPPAPEVFAICHLYYACIRLVDALAVDGMCDCMEDDEYRAIVFTIRMCATNLESSIKLHPMIKKAEQRFLKALIRLDREAIDCGYLRLETIETISVPSAN
jgi:hypothetical protein